MKKKIDCLLVGYNEVGGEEFEINLIKMGTKSGAYRDFNLNFVNYNGKPHSVSDIFNLFYRSESDSGGEKKSLHIGETFNLAVAFLGSFLSGEGLVIDYINAFQEEN